jgi:hypothetical protein
MLLDDQTGPVDQLGGRAARLDCVLPSLVPPASSRNWIEPLESDGCSATSQ